MLDHYESFDQLSFFEKLGQDYVIRAKNRESETVVLAPHGGEIEPGTTEIAENIAGNTFNFYTFEGVKKTGNAKLHITSSNFDEPQAVKMVKQSRQTIAIHGCRGDIPQILIGGLDEGLIKELEGSLNDAGFGVRRVLSGYFSGTNTKNICNRNRNKRGIQLELSHGLREMLFESLDRESRSNTLEPFDVLVKTVRHVLEPAT